MVFQATTLPVLSQLLGWAGEITWGWCGELDGSGADRSDSQPHTCSRTAGRIPGNSAHRHGKEPASSTLSSITTTDRKVALEGFHVARLGAPFLRGLVLGSNSCISSEGHPRASPGLLSQPSSKHLRAQATFLPSDPSSPPPSSVLSPLLSSSTLIQASCSIHDLLSLAAAGPTHQPTQHPSFSKPHSCRTQRFTKQLQPWPSSGPAQPHVYRSLMHG